MLAIKLQRIGKKHQPSFRVVVAERRSKLGGPPVEDLGSYNLRTKVLAVTKEKLERWLRVGAQPTVTVHNLFVKNGLVGGPKIAVKMKKPVKVETAVEAQPAAAVAEKPAKQEAGAEATAETKPAEQVSEGAETAESVSLDNN